MLWLGIEKPVSELQKLAADLEDAFSVNPWTIFDLFGPHRQYTREENLDIVGSINVTLSSTFTESRHEVEVHRRLYCNECMGTGDASGKQITCKACKGHGRVRVKHGMFVVNTSCDQCHGRGTVLVDPCAVCSGNGYYPASSKINITVPRSIVDGSVLRVPNMGNNGKSRSGHLYITVNVIPEARIKRENDDLHIQLSIPVLSAILGDRVPVQDFYGTCEIQIPPGTQFGDSIKVDNFGMYKSDGDRGNLYAHIHIEIPTEVSDEERECYEYIRCLGPTASTTG